MAKTIIVKFDDGSSHTFDNVPDDVTDDQISERAASLPQFSGLSVAKVQPKVGALESFGRGLIDFPRSVAKVVTQMPPNELAAFDPNFSETQKLRESNSMFKNDDVRQQAAQDQHGGAFASGEWAPAALGGVELLRRGAVAGGKAAIKKGKQLLGRGKQEVADVDEAKIFLQEIDGMEPHSVIQHAAIRARARGDKAAADQLEDLLDRGLNEEVFKTSDKIRQRALKEAGEELLDKADTGMRIRDKGVSQVIDVASESLPSSVGRFVRRHKKTIGGAVLGLAGAKVFGNEPEYQIPDDFESYKAPDDNRPFYLTVNELNQTNSDFRKAGREKDEDE